VAQHTKTRFPPEAIREDFIPKDAYYSREFAALEEERLWPRVWQMVGRLEEFPKVGDYLTYDILGDSILIVRNAPDSLKAYHNVCMHRGRRLLDGCGSVQEITCRFHGWRYNLNGENTRIVDAADWGGRLTPEDTHLREVLIDTWGGWVFINMDPEAESLASFLSPMQDYLDKFEFESLRYHWFKTTILPSNWKTAVEFFNEFYHVQQAHPQVLPFTNDYSKSGGFGKHGMMWFEAEGSVPLSRSPRLPAKTEPDYRNFVLDFVERYHTELEAMVTTRHYHAAQRLRTEVEASASPTEVLTKWMQFRLEAAEADGSGWPKDLPFDYINRSGLDWHVFPNFVFLHGTVDGLLGYRARPNGDDPESCIFDVFSLQRFGPGKAPVLNREFHPDWRAAKWPRIYAQDFVNIPEVQKGMHSRGFTGSRPNPVQERAITHFHRTLRSFIADGGANADR
jgi:phenylpropionate dioxygenase-like ring-hydroxylating dioxygenase large terminal subunit